MTAGNSRQAHNSNSTHGKPSGGLRSVSWRGKRASSSFIQLPINPTNIQTNEQTVESQAEDSRGISFVDDVTWTVEGADVDDVVQKPGRCAGASLRWADDNAVRFETSETEAVLPPRKRKHRRCEREVRLGALQAVHEWRRWDTIWTDGSHLDGAGGDDLRTACPVWVDR